MSETGPADAGPVGRCGGRGRRLVGRAASLATALICFSAAAGAGHARAETGSLTIRPAVAEGVADAGQRIGPFGIANTTGERYAMRVFPVLLAQKRDGALYVRQSRGALERAGRTLKLTGDRAFVLKPGSSNAAAATLARVPRSHSFYGGVLFQGTPAATPGASGVSPILQLNARVYLRPPAGQRRPRAGLTSLRAEQAGKRRLRVLVGFANLGNLDLQPRGALVVRDASGAVRFQGPVEGFDVLPQARVDLPVDLGPEILPAGDYSMHVAIRAAGRTLRLQRPLKLFGPNQVATQQAEIIRFDSPQAENGEETEIELAYRNTGNVSFQPTAELLVSGTDGAIPLETSTTGPGEEARATGSVMLEGIGSRQLTVRLLAGARELDRRTATVTPVAARSLIDRITDWLIEHAVILVIGLLCVIAIMAALFGVYVRRRLRQSPRPVPAPRGSS